MAPESEDISPGRSRGQVQEPWDEMQANVGDYRRDPGFLGLWESSEVS